jgi:bilirubin oxidase
MTSIARTSRLGASSLTRVCLTSLAALLLLAEPGAPRLAMRAHTADVPNAPSVVVSTTVARRTVELTLTAAPARLTLRPGVASDVYAYNGQVPGPTLQLREGDRVVVHFRNALPVPSTIHWHGIHLPFTADGSPFHPVAPGGTHDYVFTIPRGTAGTYWYHPHPDHTTGEQVARGLYGGIVVRADDDPLPASLREQLLILSDNRFLPDGAIDLPARHSPRWRTDVENGREGDVLFVSGAVRPTLTIRSGEVQRWRVVNASAARIYRLALPGHRFLQVGSDGGLFERPVERDELVLGVGERAELLVRAAGAPGTHAVLQTLPYDRYVPQTRPPDWNVARDLLVLRYSDAAPVRAPPIPRTLRHVPALDTAQATATRVMVLTQHMINGKHMDMARVDVAAKLGATEIWEVENLVGMDHPFHLHGFQFQVLDRNGVPEPYRSWKDVVNVPRHETARFIVRYDDFAGRWMYHCHILSHEDHGMMGVLEVTP